MKDKEFTEYIENKVKSTIKKYSLLSKKDKILVACSGGKDSTAILHILNKLGYKTEAIIIDVSIGNYSKTNVKNIREFCKKNRTKLHEFSYRTEFGYSLCYIRSLLKEKGIKLNSCTICGILRRHIINKKARELKAAKLVTGHNLDDEAQSIIMNLLKNDLTLLLRLGPKTGLIKDKRFIPRVKPLYFITEKEVTKYSKINKFPVNYAPCPCSTDAYRRFILNNLNKLEKINPDIKQNIINNFLRILPKLKKTNKTNKTNKTTGKPGACSGCGEPSNKNRCSACLLIEKIK